MFEYKTRGTCSQRISFSIEDGKLRNVSFEGGCAGNLAGLAALTEGADAMETARKLQGVQCGFRGTSCPDQFALAIEKALMKEKTASESAEQAR
jgi:uncharacterized protein (TIGR03905 family)